MIEEEVLLNPSVWQNISCDGEIDGDCFEKFPNDEDCELYPLNGGSLIDNLTSSDEIPDMDSFREISVSPAKRTQTEMTSLFIKTHH